MAARIQLGKVSTRRRVLFEPYLSVLELQDKGCDASELRPTVGKRHVLTDIPKVEADNEDSFANKSGWQTTSTFPYNLLPNKR